MPMPAFAMTRSGAPKRLTKSCAANWVATASATSTEYVATVPGSERVIGRRAISPRVVLGEA